MLESLINLYYDNVFNVSRVDKPKIKVIRGENGDSDNYEVIIIKIKNRGDATENRLKILKQFNNAYVEVMSQDDKYWDVCTSMVFTDLLALELGCEVRLIEDNRVVYNSQLENFPNYDSERVDEFMFRLQTSTLFGNGRFEVVNCKSVRHMVYITIYQSSDLSDYKLFVVNCLNSFIIPIKNWDNRIIKLIKTIYTDEEKIGGGC